ncbi:hypothetical protein Val02_65060 [Virgisporangium aliadipatigenens]|uniref:Uncharacterized protein n=1 Tax=Virgisporangium aliadipatigenens TaxID=741659 RepID=A0A8J3YTG5_9ACTN|nr:DUF2199 domain-containing protein [Virgisporangium aliadipatigenens]GIJ49620.1 hypothetical protein Val02_65060 [Virgisporangium aliadipatigenens]
MSASFDIRVGRPDAVYDIPEPERRETVRGNDFLLREERAGWFVRCLLPVSLTGGVTVTFGAWVRVDEETFGRIGSAWQSPSYPRLRFTGEFGNAVQPWGSELLGAPVSAAVRDEDALPYVVADASAPLLSTVVTDTWERDEVLSSLWQALPVAVEHRVTRNWSVRRGAGMRAMLHEGQMRFVGPGRTVIIDAFNVPAGQTAEEVTASTFADAPPHAEHFREDDRRAYRVSSTRGGAERHDLYAVVTGPTGFLLLNCVHDAAGDAGWALETFRSVRFDD